MRNRVGRRVRKRMINGRKGGKRDKIDFWKETTEQAILNAGAGWYSHFVQSGKGGKGEKSWFEKRAVKKEDQSWKNAAEQGKLKLVAADNVGNETST